MRFFADGLGKRVASSLLNYSVPEDITAEEHLADYVALAEAADRMLKDPSAKFVLIHMPIPHPCGIYDRRNRKFSLTNSDYLDNVALADRFLLHVRSELEQSGQWDASTIVVMADAFVAHEVDMGGNARVRPMRSRSPAEAGSSTIDRPTL